MKTPVPGAVLFDMDGLLVDTETADWESWRDLYAELGRELTLDEYCGDAGLYGSWERRYARLSVESGRAAAELGQLREPHFRRRVAERLGRRPHLEALLEELHAEGFRTGVASSSDRDWVGYLLDGLGLTEVFQTIVCGEDVVHRKPHPDIYQMGAHRLSVECRVCVAVEDSAHGIHAALAAGCRVVNVPNVVTRRQDLSGAHLTLEELEHIDVALVRSVLSHYGQNRS